MASVMASPITLPAIAPATPKKIPPHKAGIVNRPVSIAPKIISGVAPIIFLLAKCKARIGIIDIPILSQPN